MSTNEVVSVLYAALMVALKICAPLLIASIAIGLIVAIFQAATQIHEQTLTFVPKIIVIAVILVLAGSWMLGLLDEFFILIFDHIAKL